jgi:hypothetical protein
MEFQSDRHFQVWDYHVSHSRMLIRSSISPENSTNQDIIFYSVDFLDIPTIFRGLTLATVGWDEALGAGIPADEFGHSTVFRLETDGKRFYIVALACYIYENELDLFDSSLQEPWEDQPREDLGRLLARS